MIVEEAQKDRALNGMSRPIISMENLEKSWKQISSFLKKPETEADLMDLTEFSEEIYEKIHGDKTHPLYSLYKVAESLIVQYEDDHFTEPDTTPADYLRLFMEQHELKQADLVNRGLASSGVVSELLSGKREFSKRHIQILSDLFRCSPAIFFPRKGLRPQPNAEPTP